MFLQKKISSTSPKSQRPNLAILNHMILFSSFNSFRREINAFMHKKQIKYRDYKHDLHNFFKSVRFIIITKINITRYNIEELFSVKCLKQSTPQKAKFNFLLAKEGGLTKTDKHF